MRRTSGKGKKTGKRRTEDGEVGGDLFPLVDPLPDLLRESLASLSGVDLYRYLDVPPQESSNVFIP
jgi:hypothetical protein